jgi:HPt (histidine-containing phosphotransfer) domain-containing protein
MTAHTMKGDRERCMDAGMDGYVSKPVQREALFEAIALGTGSFSSPLEKVPVPLSPAEEGPLASSPAEKEPDEGGTSSACSKSKGTGTLSRRREKEPVPSAMRAGLLERVGGDEKLLDELIRVFVHDARRMLGEIRSAVARGDVETLARAAHAFKGSVSNFPAKAAFRAAQELGSAAREGKLDLARAAAHTLETEFRRLEPRLLMLLKESVR